MFRSHSDHPQGARIFLTKVTDFKICIQSGIPLQTERTYTHHMLCCRITTLTFYILTNFKTSDFNKKYTSSLRMI